MFFNLINHFWFDKSLRWCSDITKLLANLYIVFHAASKDTNLTVKFDSCFNCLLYSIYIRSKCGEDNTSFTFSKDIFDVLTDFFSLIVKLGTVALVESDRRSKTPSSPSFAIFAKLAGSPTGVK